MALTSRNNVSMSNVTRTKVCVSRPAIRPVHVVSAGRKEQASDSAGDYVSKGFLSIFSKPQSNMDNWEGTGNSFTGKIARRGDKKPFSDGYKAPNNKASKSSVKSQPVEEAAAPEGILGYLGKALERLLGHNFKGESTEPDWKGSGSSGWKGNVHSRKGNSGFHSKKF